MEGDLLTLLANDGKYTYLLFDNAVWIKITSHWSTHHVF